jgi:hypothetical protein
VGLGSVGGQGGSRKSLYWRVILTDLSVLSEGGQLSTMCRLPKITLRDSTDLQNKFEKLTSVLPRLLWTACLGSAFFFFFLFLWY